jgi:hypothetical protein
VAILLLSAFLNPAKVNSKQTLIFVDFSQPDDDLGNKLLQPGCYDPFHRPVLSLSVMFDMFITSID